ncbi:MAG: hypothetical protein HQ474_08550 [Flammeovirgaceae bacterium]|nr:hypothetical protein [Flammeovirgaceae bacterium]
MALEDNNDIIIGEYLTGRLSDADKVLLEARMKENPDLNSQVKNEEQIMEGINEFKRISLKAKLSAIDIPSNVVFDASGLVSSGLSKVLYVAAGVVMIGVGYYFINPVEPVQEQLNEEGFLLGDTMAQQDDLKDISSIDQEVLLNDVTTNVFDEVTKSELQEESPTIDYVDSENTHEHMGQLKLKEEVKIVDSASSVAVVKSFPELEKFEPVIARKVAKKEQSDDIGFNNKATRSRFLTEDTEQPLSVKFVDKKSKKLQYTYQNKEVVLMKNFEKS